MRFDSVVDAIGHTPLVRLRVPAPDGVEVFAKLELANLFAMKDRVAKQVILDARRTGALAEGAPVIESSSGTMALGLALVGTYLGHPVHIVTDPRIDPITLTKLETLGCVVHVVEAMTGAGWQSARLERLAQLMADLPGAYWPRQYANPLNPLAYRALAAELRVDLPGDAGCATSGPDILVGSVGSGGSLCGTARALLDDRPDLRVVGIDCVGSVLFAQPDWPQRRQSGLGNSLQPENIDYSLFDEVHWLSDAEAFDATRRLAREQKLFGGNTSGSVYRILCHLAKSATPGTRLVGILPDRGDRYVDSVYRAEPGPVAEVPVEVPYGTEVRSWSYARIPRTHRKSLVFIESNTTGTGMLALRTAARLGFTPVFVTGNPQRYAGLADIRCRVIECDTNDLTALREAIDADQSAGITTTSEFYLPMVAELAAEHGLPGNPVEALRTCRDKSQTRQVLAQAGIGQPDFVAVRAPEEAAAAVATIGLPCVVKPADDSGSNDVLLCHTVDEAVAQAARILAVTTNVRGQPTAGTALVEQYLDGPEFSVEMFDGALVGITAKRVTGVPWFVEDQHIFPADLPAATAGELAETVRRALKATGLERGAAHVEAKLPTPRHAESAPRQGEPEARHGEPAPRQGEPDAGNSETGAGNNKPEARQGNPAIVEINARLAGGMIPELIRHATGIDLLEQQLRTFAGLPVNLTPTRARHAGIRFLLAPSAGRLVDVAGLDAARRVPGIEQVTVTASPGTEIRPPRNAYDRLGYVIAVAPTYAEVEKALQEAVSRIEIRVDGQ